MDGIFFYISFGLVRKVCVCGGGIRIANLDQYFVSTYIIYEYMICIQKIQVTS